MVQATREGIVFYKHMTTVHGGVYENNYFGDFFEIVTIKAYKKPFTRNVEEGTYIANHEGEVINSKTEWHQTQINRTKVTVIQGGANQFLEAGEAGRS